MARYSRGGYFLLGISTPPWFDVYVIDNPGRWGSRSPQEFVRQTLMRLRLLQMREF